MMLLSERTAQRHTPGADRGQDWRDDALCRDADPELFHPPPKTERVHPQVAAALAICAKCPVVAQCRTWADEIGDDWAILGGTTAAERRAARLAQSRMRKRWCRWCSTPFVTINAVYCSAGCRDQTKRAQRATRRRGRAAVEEHVPTILRLARSGHNDRQIAEYIGGLTPGQVQYLRQREEVPAGSRAGRPSEREAAV